MLGRPNVTVAVRMGHRDPKLMRSNAPERNFSFLAYRVCNVSSAVTRGDNPVGSLSRMNRTVSVAATER